MHTARKMIQNSGDEGPPEPKQGFAWGRVSSYIAVFMIALVIGYFAGREHLKYEIRTAMLAGFQKLQQGLPGLPGLAPSVLPTAPTPAVSSSPPPAPAPAPAPAPGPAPLSIELVSKGFHDSNASAGDFEDLILFTLSIKNLSDKNIRAFDGTLTFTDLLDNPILSSNLAINDPVQIGKSMTWEGQIHYNEFRTQDQNLRAASQANIKLVFSPHKVLFSDGTTKTY